MTHQSHQSFWLSSIRFELGSSWILQGQNAQRTQQPMTQCNILQANSHSWKLTWFTKKSPNWKETSSSKPSFLCNNFPGCTHRKSSYTSVFDVFFSKAKDSTTVKHHEMDHTNISKSNALLAGGFKYCLFHFISNLTWGNDSQFDLRIFFRGVETTN